MTDTKITIDSCYTCILLAISCSALASIYMTIKFLQEILLNYWIENLYQKNLFFCKYFSKLLVCLPDISGLKYQVNKPIIWRNTYRKIGFSNINFQSNNSIKFLEETLLSYKQRQVPNNLSLVRCTCSKNRWLFWYLSYGNVLVFLRYLRANKTIGLFLQLNYLFGMFNEFIHAQRSQKAQRSLGSNLVIKGITRCARAVKKREVHYNKNYLELLDIGK